MVINLLYLGFVGDGYIRGTLTVRSNPASRTIVLLDADTLSIRGHTISNNAGDYLFSGLNANRSYLVIARDYKKEYEPFAWDYVKPADDLTIDEQLALWRSWQPIN